MKFQSEADFNQNTQWLYRCIGFICYFEKVPTKWRQILKVIYNFQWNVGPFCQVRLFIYGKRKGMGSDLSWRVFWVIRNSPWELLPLIPFHRLMPLSHKDVWLSLMNHFVRRGAENMSGDTHSAKIGLMAGWTMGLRDKHELWCIYIYIYIFFFFKKSCP